MFRYKIAILFSLGFLLFALPVRAHGQASASDKVSEEETSMEKSGEMMQEADKMEENVNSYDLFWPVAAGKTRGESMYFLKRLKEKVRGALIFGKPQKTDYRLFLATKRVVEVEKLLMNDDIENASETLEEMEEEMLEGLEVWRKIPDEDKVDTLKSDVDELNNKLNNLNKFVPYLKTNFPGKVDSKLDSIQNAIKDFKSSV